MRSLRRRASASPVEQVRCIGKRHGSDLPCVTGIRHHRQHVGRQVVMVKPFAIVGSGRLMRNVGRLVIVQRVRMIVMMHMRRRSRDRSVVTAHMRTPSYTRNYQRAKQSEEQQTDHVVADTIILDRGNANDDRSSDDFLST